jgi:SAM-dependent methyltransferase
MTTPIPTINWLEHDQTHSLRWHSEAGAVAPKRVQIADDTLSADSAYRLACEGTALLWRGDFQNARQLLTALAHRVDRKPAKASKTTKHKKNADTNAAASTEANALPFHLHRQAQAQRARVLAMLLIPFEANYQIPLKRAPDVQAACAEVMGMADTPGTPFVMSLRELLGIIGAHQWRKNGVPVPALGGKITPFYGVYSPVRGEYLELVAKAPLPSACHSHSDTNSSAFDIGTGTGVLACILAQRGLQKIVATDLDPRALACAAENIHRLKLDQHISLQANDLFPAGKAALIVCNPPWLPVRPNSSIERAIYDPDSRMLRGFLANVAAHLLPGGAAWLIMSNFAELLGLRDERDLCNWIDAGGLQVAGKMDIKPQHPKSTDANDPLHQARSAEVTSLWRLTLK